MSIRKKKSDTERPKKVSAKDKTSVKKHVVKSRVKKTAATKSKKINKVKVQSSKEIDSTLSQEKKFHVLGIGASAGGLEAFEKFFQNMPPDSGMAFILVPHLDPKHISMMPDIIRKYTEMKVCQIKDGIKIEPNFVYLIPPNKDLAILHGVLQLIEFNSESGLRMRIDYFFRSLAEDQKEKSVCVILSGMGTDGTLGLKAIKSELGMVMVQDPETAKCDSMPRSAIQTGLVDYVLPPEKMPEQIIKYSKHLIQGVSPKFIPTKRNLTNELQKICILLRSRTGHDFSLYKQNTICRRIERRMNVNQIDNVSNYVRYLQEIPEEIDALFKDILIGVTSFFRDKESFEVLRKNILPELFKNKSNDYSVRIWVSGCSTGEEAYSIAIILREYMEETQKQFDVQIFGTDIDSDAIDSARNAVFPSSISADVSPERLRKFFVKDVDRYRIRKDIREMLIFAQQDVIKDPPFTKLDLLSCRNLLIYMDSELQKKLFPLFHYSIKPDGFLFLGTSETIGEFADLFKVVDKKWKIFKRKDYSSARYRMLEFPISRVEEHIEKVPDKKRPEFSISQSAEKTLLRYYAPASVIINKSGEILYIHGRTGKYLEPAPGEAHLNIIDMAREGLKLEIPAAIRKVQGGKKEVVVSNLCVKVNGNSHFINLIVRPLDAPFFEGGTIMITFEDVVPPQKLEPYKTRKDLKKGIRRKPGNQIEELEKELAYTKESLQTTIEELETSNEELKSTNEELQSTNEELQSSNEELETSKEELQSLNEEISTVNAELQNKIDDLSIVINDIKNLMDSTEIPTLFLDNNLCIKRFTDSISKLINVIVSDIGRPIGHIVTNLKYDGLVKDANEVINKLIPCERELETKNGQWYLMRIVPYRTVDNVIDGVVIIFLNIHEQKTAVQKVEKLNKQLQQSLDFSENIINTVHEPLIILDSDLKVMSVNNSFYKTFQVTPEETKDRFIYNLGNNQWDIPDLRKLLEEIIPQNNFFENYEIEHEFPKIGHKKFVLNARKLLGTKKDEEKILLAIRDISILGDIS